MEASCRGGGRAFLNVVDALKLKVAASFTLLQPVSEADFQMVVSTGWKIDFHPQPVFHFC